MLVAKLDIASDSDSEDRGFESRRARSSYHKGLYMKYEKNRKIAGIDEYKIISLMKFLIIPIIIIILIIVIAIGNIVTDHKDQIVSSDITNSIEDDSGTDVDGESISPDNNIYSNDFSDYGVVKNTIPEIDELVSAYQKAKTDGDASAMYAVFGRSDTDGLEEMQDTLSEERKVYEAYENTVNYITAGIGDDSYIVYISCDVKFKGIDTLAPMLTWAYVYKDQSGKLSMKEPDKLTSKEKELVDKTSVSEDVMLLDNEMK